MCGWRGPPPPVSPTRLFTYILLSSHLPTFLSSYLPIFLLYLPVHLPSCLPARLPSRLHSCVLYSSHPTLKPASQLFHRFHVIQLSDTCASCEDLGYAMVWVVTIFISVFSNLGNTQYLSNLTNFYRADHEAHMM